MMPDVSLPIISSLARTMTLKFGFARSAMGGAKAGIVGDPEDYPDKKLQLLAAFGQAIKPLLRSGCYTPGPDIGTTPEDMRYMLSAVGVKVRDRAFSTNGGFYTGLTVLASAIGAAQHVGIKLLGASLAIEGFGAVGSSVARVFSEKGIKLVAISTARGAIYNEKGLDVDKLIKLYNRRGSSVVEAYKEAQQMDRSRILELNVDLLSPCASYHSITSENVERVAARIICPGANIPVTPEAEQILFQKGILSIPDFVANCGGVLAVIMDAAGRDFARTIIESKIAPSVTQLLKEADSRGLLPRKYAEKIATERFLNSKVRAETGKMRLLAKVPRFALQHYSKSLPQLPLSLVSRWYARQRMLGI
jgi:glutamate dehydrogenase (NAD(P)+)